MGQKNNPVHLLLALALLFLITGIQQVSAQSYDYMNQWYRFNQNYIKLRLDKDGHYRVSKTDLENANVSGASNIDPDKIQVIFRGKEIPIYVRKNGTSLDYFEFLGRKNDGGIDSLMYRKPAAPFSYDPEQQPSRYSSFFTDTTSYFVTWDSMGTARQNVVSTGNYSTYSPEPWYRYRVVTEFMNTYFKGGGGATEVGHILNPDYITGEGFVSGQFETGDHIDVQAIFVPTPGFAGTGNPTRITSRILASTTANEHITAIDINAVDEHFDTTAGINIHTIAFNYTKTLTASTLLRFHAYGNGNKPDKQHVAWNHFDYDRTFDLNGDSRTEIRDFNHSNTTYLRFYNADVASQAWIWDPWNGDRISATVTGDTLHFLVPGNANSRKLYVFTDQSLNVPIIEPRTSLSNLSNPAGGVEFVIITHKRFTNSALQYANYRDTTSLNPMSTKVVYVDEIMDEFGYGSFTSWAIKNFCKYALDNWTTRPKYFLIWGKGRTSPRSSNISNYVPSFGQPANDFEYVSNFDRDTSNFEPEAPIGRVSIYNDSEGMAYLKKVDEYEHTPYDGWMKKAVFLGGGKANNEQVRIRQALVDNYKSRLEDPPIGGSVAYFQSINNGIETNTEMTSEEAISNGAGLIHFFGHSGTNIFDVDIFEASRYKNWHKYPFMIAFGCYGGNFVELEQSFGERFILEPDRGAIGYLANTTAGFLQQLKEYGLEFYDNATGANFGQPIGDILKATIRDYANNRNGYANVLTANHAKQMNLQGDPAVVIRFPIKPDLHIEAPDVFVTPENFSALDQQYNLNVVVHNDGSSFPDSFRVRVRHKTPLGNVIEYAQITVSPVSSKDTVVFSIENSLGPALAGLNNYEVFVDALDSLDEYSESNNIVNHEELVQGNTPAILMPYEYAIVGEANISLSASTYIMALNPNLNYKFEIDTVYTFDSPFKIKSGPVNGTASFCEWNLPFSMQSEQVYYWRVRLADIYPITWNSSSFKYIPTKTGWSQSRPPQFLKDRTDQIEMDPLDLDWQYELHVKKLHALIHSFGFNGLPEYFLGTYSSNNLPPDGIMFTNIDHRTLEPDVRNTLWGDWRFLPSPTASSPDALSDMITAITTTEKDDYFLIVTANNPYFENWEESWLKAMEMIGVRYEDLAELKNGDRAIILGRKGGIPGSAYVITSPNQPVGNQPPRHELLVDLSASYSEGTIFSTTIGPTTSWDEYTFDWTTLDLFLHEDLQTRVFGVRSDGQELLIMEDLSKGLHSMNTVDPGIYPYLRLEAEPKDGHFLTPPQLSEWEIYYVPGPDVAVEPNITFSAPDTIDEGEIVRITLTALNVSAYDMDSLLVDFYLQRQDRTRFLLGSQRYGRVSASSSIDFEYKFHSAGKGLVEGDAMLIVEVNPGNDQIEQYHFNNFYFHNIYVKTDKVGPILDVTFDGKHIMEGDIISPEPEIVVQLNDDNQYLPVTVSDSTYRFWFGTERTFTLNPEIQIDNNSQIEIVPGQLPDNKAQMIFRPDRLGDGEYTLAVQGFDFKGNEAGKVEYVIHFNVVNEKAISDVLPYPNPFSTSTRWVFTLTGDEKPYVFEIQVYTITGRLIKTIDLLAEEDVKFGYNITNYAWDGRDEYGDLLANGVYLYKVKYKFLDRFGVKHRDEGLPKNIFRNGFGKLYIMR